MAFGIIGLGRFGTALATSLAKTKHEVLVLDCSEAKIKNIQHSVAQALVVERLDKPTLKEAGIESCEIVIICIGEEQDTSIITTLNVLELGISRVIARAVSLEHGQVLSKLGAEVIYPEQQQAFLLAQRLTAPNTIDKLNLSNDMTIAELKINNTFNEIKIGDAEIKTKYEVSIIAIINDDYIQTNIDSDFILMNDMHIIVLGKKENIKKLEIALEE